MTVDRQTGRHDISPEMISSRNDISPDIMLYMAGHRYGGPSRSKVDIVIS